MKASTKTSTAKKQQQPQQQQQQQQRQHVPAHVVIRAPEHGGGKMKGVPAVQVGDARLSSMLEQCCSMMTSFVSVDGMMQDKDMPPTSSGMGHAMLRMMMKEQHDDDGMMQGKDMLPPVMRQRMGRSDVEPPASSMEMLCQQMARKLLSDGIARQMLAECGMVTPSCGSSDDVTDRWLQMMMTTMSSTSVSPTGAGTDPLMQQMMTMKAGGSAEAWQQMMKSSSVSLPGGMKEMLSSSERPGEVEGVMALCMACCVGMCCTMGQTLTEVLPCLLTEEKEETSPSSTEAMGGLAGCMAVLLSCCSTIESLCRDESRRRMMQKDPKTMANCAAMMRAIMSCCACLAATCCRMENDRSRKPCSVPDPACPKETVMVDCLPPAAQLLCCMTTACAMGCAGMMASCLVMCCPPSSTMHPEWTHQSMTECGMMCCSMVCCSQMMERIRHLMTLPSLRDEPAAAECCLRCCCSVSTAMASCCGVVTTVLTACDPPLRSTAEQEPRPWAMVAPVMSCMLSCCGMMAELQSMPCVMQRVCGSPSSMSLMACGTAACLSACCDLALDEGVRAAAAGQPALSRSLLCCVAGGCLVVDTLRECVMANEITRGDSLLCCMLGCLTSCCSLLCARMNKMSSSSSVDNEAERCLACCAALDDMLSQRMQQRGGGRPTKEKAAKDKSCEGTNRGVPASMISTVAVCCSLGCRLVLKEQPCKAPQVEMRMQSILSSCCELLVRDTRSCDPPMSSEGCCVDECMAVCMASCMLSPCCVLPETVVSRVGLPEEDLPCLASACSMLACCRAMKDVIPMLCDGRPPRKDSASGGPPGLLTKRSMVAMVVCCCSCMALCQGLCVTARCTPSAGSTMSSGMAVPNCMAGCCGMMEEALEEACRSIQMHGVEEMDCVMPLQCVGVVCCSLSACLCTMAPCCGVASMDCCDMQKSTIRCCDSLCQMMAQMCRISHPQKSIGMGTAGCLLRVTATVCSGMGCLMTTLCSQNATSTCASSMMRMTVAPAGGHTVSLSQMECSPASLEVLKMLPSTCQAICRRMQEAALLYVEVQGGAGRDVTEMMAMCCSMGMLSLTCCCMCCGLQRDACQVGRAMAETDMADARLCQQMEEAMEQALHCCTMMQRSAKELLSVSVPAHSRDLVIAMAAACCGCSSAISGRMACLPVSMAAGTCGSDTAMACMAAMMRQPRSAMKKSMLRMKACMQSMMQGCLEVEMGLSCALAERQSRLQLDDVKEKGSTMMMTELCSGCHSIGMQCCGMGMMAMCSLGSCCGIPSMLMNRAMPKEDCRLMMRAMMDCCVPSPECLLRVIEEMACCCKGMMDASFMACCMGGQVMPSVALCGMCGMLSAVGCAMTCGCRMRCLMKGMPMSERIVCRKAHLEAASLIDCCKKDMDRMTSMVMPQPRQGLPRETLVACLCAVDQICCAPAGMMPSTGVGVMGHRVAVKRREQEKHRAEELLRESCQSAQEGMKKGCNLLMNRCQMVGAIPGMVPIEKEKEAEISVRKAMGTCGEKMRECCAEGMRHCIKVATKEDASSLAACVDALCAQECKDHGVPRGKAHQMSRTIH